MTSRTSDPSIPADEALYRAIAERKIGAEWIDSQGTSVARSKYATPDEVRAIFKLPHIAQTTSALVSAQPEILASNGERYEFFAVDAPEDGRTWHAEVRWRKVGEVGEVHRAIKSKAVKVELRDALASRFTLLP